MSPFQQRDDDLVVLAKFNGSSEAHTLRILLEANGIRATVTNEESSTTISTSFLGPMSLVHIEVCVFRSDIEEATLVMNQVPAASDAMFPEWKCQCGETVDQGFSICWSCGKPHPDSKEP